MLLTAILVIPIVAALFILFALKPEQRSEIRLVAAAAAGATLILSILVFIEASQPAPWHNHAPIMAFPPLSRKSISPGFRSSASITMSVPTA